MFGIVSDGFLGTDTCKFTYTNLYNKVWNEKYLFFIQKLSEEMGQRHASYRKIPEKLS